MLGKIQHPHGFVPIGRLPIVSPTCQGATSFDQLKVIDGMQYHLLQHSIFYSMIKISPRND
jgi:hypothetical protein